MHRACSQKMSLTLASIWGKNAEENVRNSTGKWWILGGAPCDFTENEPKLRLNMERKLQGLPQENSGFWGGAPRDFAETELKLSLCMGEENVMNSKRK